MYEYDDSFWGNKLVWVDDCIFDCAIWAEDVIEKFIIMWQKTPTSIGGG